MRVLRSLPAFGLLSFVLVACSQVVGFGELEKSAESKSDAGGSRRDASAIDDDDTTRDGGSPVVRDADVDAGDGAIPPASTACPGTPATYLPPWKTPPARTRPCRSGDLDAFVANERQLYETQKQAMIVRNAACAACMYTKETDPTWGPLTLTNDQRMFIDFGLCYRAAGASEACGSKAHELEWCLQKICNVCATGQNMQDCRSGAMAGTCKSAFDGTVSACSGHGTIVNDTCRTSREVVGVLCGGT